MNALAIRASTSGSTAAPIVLAWGQTASVREVLDSLFETVDPDVSIALAAMDEEDDDWDDVKARLRL